MKTLIATAILASSAAFIGWHGDEIYNHVRTETAHDISAVVEYFRYDPEKAFTKCFTTAADHDPDSAGKCGYDLKRWIERDGAKVVMPKVQKIVSDMMLETLREAFNRGTAR